MSLKSRYGIGWRFWVTLAVWFVVILVTDPPWWFVILAGALIGWLTALWEHDAEVKAARRDMKRRHPDAP